jgi:tripartite-type tricarboxylate transporter receptor subunit TctC
MDWAGNAADRAVIEFMSSSSQMGQSFVAPAGVPAPIVEALRRAFDATMKDPDFRGVMAGAKLEINAMTGEALQAFVEQTMRAQADVVARYKAATAAE